MAHALLFPRSMNTKAKNSTTITPISSARAAKQRHAASAKSRDAIVEAHMPMVLRIAKRVHRRTNGQADIDELVGWGITGLLEAMDRYVEGGNATLATFAYYRVRGAMLDGIGKIAPLSRKSYRQAAAAGDLHAIYAADIDPDEIVDNRANSNPEECTARNEVNEVLRAAIDKLPAQQRTLVMDHYFGNATLQQSGRSLGISKSWASRAHASALETLRLQLEHSAAIAA